MRIAVLVLLAAPLLLACTPSGQPAALEASRAFQRAVESGDTTAACQLLSDEARGNLESASAQPCPESLARLDLPPDPPQSVQVWGDNAQVRTDSGVLFLAKFSSGWRLTGVGCRPRPERPYDCTVEG